MPILDYRDILRQEFLKIREKNSGYTLKQFSEDCGLSGNRMSDILNRRYGVSKKNGEKIAKNLGIESNALEVFLLSIEAEHARSKLSRELAQEKLNKMSSHNPERIYSEEELDGFLNWYDLAIVELMRHPHFNNDLDWLSIKLDTPLMAIKKTLQRMVEVGSVSNFNGEYKVNYDFFSTSSEIPSASIKRYHTQILDITRKAIDNKKATERDVSSTSFLCDPKSMDAIKNRIKSFVLELGSEFEVNKDSSELHVLNVQFFSPTINKE